MKGGLMVKFKDLSGWLKLAIVGGLISIFENALYFIVGFFEGYLGY